MIPPLVESLRISVLPGGGAPVGRRPCMLQCAPFALIHLSGRAQGEVSYMERQRVLITGGAGFLGINLIRHLITRGYALTSLDVEEFDYPERNRVEEIKGDIRDKSLLDRAME